MLRHNLQFNFAQLSENNQAAAASGNHTIYKQQIHFE